MYYIVKKSVSTRYKYSLIIKRKWFLNILLKSSYLFYNSYKYNKIKNNKSISKIRNRCIINGRARSVNSKFRLSRNYFKSMSRNGLINGITKF